MTRTDGGDKSGQEKHQNRNQDGVLAHERHDLFGEQFQSAVGGGHAEEEGNAYQRDEHGRAEAVGDFLGAHAAAGTQNEGNAQGQETKVNLFNEADGDHDHQNNETDNRKIHLFFSL